MTLSETLRPYIRGELTQKAVALTWSEAMKRAGKEWTAAHVESQLSRCFKDQLPAIRFFFGDAGRGRAFLAALQVPDSEFERLLQVAEDVLARNGVRQTRLVIDVTAWSESIEPKKLFEAIRIAFIESPMLRPAALLVTRVQYDDLPRSFDRESEWLEVRCVDSSDHGLLETSALIASPKDVPDPDRWLALAFDPKHGALVVEPPDGLAQFAKLGHVNLPAIEFDLADFVDAKDLPVSRQPQDAVERRRWMAQLRRADEAAAVDPDPRMRLAIARHLGIAALALPQDRVEHELASIVASLSGAAATVATATELETHLARAKRYPTTETVLRVGDEIHVVNPADPNVSDRSRLRVHRVPAEVPAIRKLQAAVADWTIGDMEADSFLHRTLAELGSSEADMRALLHARATLSRGAANAAVRGQEVANWREILSSIVEKDPAPARLAAPGRGWALQSPVPERVADALRTLRQEDAEILKFAQSPFDSVVFDRSQSIAAVANAERHSHRRSPTFIQVRFPIDERAWIDAFDMFVNDGGEFFSAVPPVALQPLAVPTGVWEAADAQVSYLWLALRAALSNAAVRRHDGTVLMQLGHGLGVEIRATRTARLVDDAVIISLQGKDQRGVVRLIDSGFRQGTYREINIAAPCPVILHHDQVRLQIDVVASPLLGLSGAQSALHEDDDDDWSDDD